MPPKPKFTKDEIINAAFEIVRTRGEHALTAREVGKYLKTSSSPIFTVFNDMEELKTEVARKAKARFDSYMEIAESYNPAYKKRGMQWVKFAQEEPILFKLLFMQSTGNATNFDKALQIIPFGKENDITIITRDYHATPEQAEHLFRQMWTYTYGLCVLCATNLCCFTEEEVALRLGEIFRGMIYVIKSGNEKIPAIKPVERDSAYGDEIQKKHPDLRTSNN